MEVQLKIPSPRIGEDADAYVKRTSVSIVKALLLIFFPIRCSTELQLFPRFVLKLARRKIERSFYILKGMRPIWTPYSGVAPAYGLRYRSFYHPSRAAPTRAFVNTVTR